MKTQETLEKTYITETAILHMAIELSNSSWKLAFSDGKKDEICGYGRRQTLSTGK